ncbi:MAG TPA: family 14 glycosylhydrolase [Candidatus Hydrogenedentes bacterium]|nr:family 14 glycosylhydrolase [Candidatus Hydrogenedentota bacterium]
MSISLFTCSVLLGCAGVAFADPIATFAPGDKRGLDVVTGTYGVWECRNIEGRRAIGLDAPSNYIYFKVSPEVREAIGQEFYMIVDFLDDGIGVVRLQYNSAGSPYEHGPGLVTTNGGKWTRGLLHVTDAHLRGLQEAGADFRLYYPGDLAVARLELYAEEPDVAVLSNRERLEQAMRERAPNPQPPGMSYTFGVDADEVSALLFKYLGATSVQSYVTWETCERRGEGRWDWFRWDEQVRVLKDVGLKWVPFLILGPAYSTPDWFRASDEHFPCRCLEHGTDSKIESLWNPHLPKWIDRFLAEFAERYRDSDVIESVLLGIQGDFGEAIYSVFGEWTKRVPGPYHNHPGFWCGDAYALADFRDFARQRYRRIKRVNDAWGTEFASWAELDVPGRGEGLLEFRRGLTDNKSPQMRRRWLDFVEWYRASMTDLAAFWMERARYHFPNTPIYLCTGGDARPEQGADFAAQCRVAAKHDAGIRITNEASDYPLNFSITRWVASAGRHYGVHFGFEPANPQNEFGIVARIYNATASGANQLFDYSGHLTHSASGMAAQRRHIKYLFHVPEPVVPVALWYPNVSITLEWGSYLPKAAAIRDYVDYDYVDETMLRTDALSRYKILVIVHGEVIETKDARRVAKWMKKGGRIIVMDVPRFESVEATDEPERLLFGDTPAGREVGKGAIIRTSGWDGLAAQLRTVLAGLQLPVCDLDKDSVFCSQIAENRFLLLNANDREAEFRIEYQAKRATGSVPRRSITEAVLVK